ncbi:hypothetical protein [Paracidovorax wautersii]|uniref:Uncharacterized protein n=1 Tax=Paracidovorax wautersii TaxID=1177982 RepID=A0A1I2HSV8_9BURK|nr:hypothetical protein [Paracidovorax wautersii]SFF33245.1 hypothetical protein SAMN04489711_1344 [Paracidovorax wautersii]
MSQFMESVRSRQQSAQSRGPGRELQANLCLQVTSYDLEAPDGGRVIGVAMSPEWARGHEFSVRMLTQEEAKATHRKDKSPAENAKFFSKQITIDKLANGQMVGRNQVDPIKVGSYIMAYGATKDGARPETGPAPWKAQYIDNFGNDASRRIETGMARVTVKPAHEYQGRYYGAQGSMELLYPGDAQVVTSFDGMKRFFDDYLPGEIDGVINDAIAVVRVVSDLPAVDGQQPRSQVFSGMVYSAKKELNVTVDSGSKVIKVPASGAETLKKVTNGKSGLARTVVAAMSGDTKGMSPQEQDMVAKLQADLAAGKVRIEVVPGRQIPIIGTSLEDLMRSNSKLANAAAKCQYKNADGVVVNGFVKMTTGVKVESRLGGGPDSVFVTSFAADVGAKGMSINSVITPNVKPEWGLSREAAAERDAQAAANSGADANPGVDADRDDDAAPQEPDRHAEASAPGM